jgi:hypothetical protein
MAFVVGNAWTTLISAVSRLCRHHRVSRAAESAHGESESVEVSTAISLTDMNVRLSLSNVLYVSTNSSAHEVDEHSVPSFVNLSICSLPVLV